MTRTHTILALLVGASSMAGCKSKGPAPGDALTESKDVVMAEREGKPSGAQALGIPSQGYDREDHGGLPHDPHGPAGHLNPPATHVSGDVRFVDAGGLKFEAPAGWEYRHPTSKMRRAEFGVQAEDGTAGLVVYFFGNHGAGSAQANIERWVGQFQNADGSPVLDARPTQRKLGDFELIQVEVAGAYVGGMGSGSPEAQPGQRMIATIVNTPKGPFYFKLLGADKVVSENRKALDAIFASMTTD